MDKIEFSKLECLNLGLIHGICEYLPTIDVISLKITSKTLNKKLEACPKIEIRVLRYKLRNTRTMLEVS